ncbi:hypothetical protein GCK32_005801 [Trichostrongylus colubriformis]
MDKNNCHVKLRNDYITLEKMEQDLDQQLAQCLQQNTAPSAVGSGTCNMRTLESSSRFSYGRTINYVPTHCFTGVQRRIERECGRVRDCCSALSRCSSITTDSSLAKLTQEIRLGMRKRAEDCRKGLPVVPLPLPAGYNQDVGFDPSSTRGGNVNVRFTEVGQSGGYDSDNVEKAVDGNINVHFSPIETNGLNQPEEDVGMVSNPVPNREEYAKVYFNRMSNGQGQSTAQFTKQDGSLILSAKPELSFPDDNMKVIKDGVVMVNVHQGAAHQGPSSVASHEEAFEHALQNTNKYKATMKELNNGDTARETLNSFLRAGQAAEAETPVKVVSSGPVVTVAVASAIPKASGSLRSLQMVNDDDDPANGDIVTSAPVIFVGNENKPEVSHRSGHCVERVMKAQTQKLQQILTMLGENKDSPDMHEIKVLIDEWHNKFRKTVIMAKEKTTEVEISKALENLIKQFDRVNLDLIKSQVNATFGENDYPDDDAAVFDTECDPLLVSEILDAQIRQQEKTEEDGVRKLLFSGGEGSLNVDNPSTIVEKVSDTSKPVSDETIIRDWSNQDYKRELEEYKKEHHINATSQPRNETACDLYMRCRNQMHMAVDSCAWRFANSKILPSLAESAESLLYRAEELCDPAEQPAYEELYELMIKRNSRLRDCLDEKNEKFFATEICLPYSPVDHLIYGSAFLRLLSEEYKQSTDCFRDANLIQEKCSKLRECCPNFDSCRQETMDVNLEQAIISKTARMNEDKQNCLKAKAREAFKNTLRDLLGKGSRETLQKLKRGEMNLDLKRGAQVLARFR